MGVVKKILDAITPEWDSAKRYKEGQDAKRKDIEDMFKVGYEKNGESKPSKRIKRDKNIRRYS